MNSVVHYQHGRVGEAPTTSAAHVTAFQLQQFLFVNVVFWLTVVCGSVVIGMGFLV